MLLLYTEETCHYHVSLPRVSAGVTGVSVKKDISMTKPRISVQINICCVMDQHDINPCSVAFQIIVHCLWHKAQPLQYNENMNILNIL